MCVNVYQIHFAWASYVIDAENDHEVVVRMEDELVCGINTRMKWQRYMTLKEDEVTHEVTCSMDPENVYKVNHAVFTDSFCIGELFREKLFPCDGLRWQPSYSEISITDEGIYFANPPIYFCQDVVVPERKDIVFCRMR